MDLTDSITLNGDASARLRSLMAHVKLWNEPVCTLRCTLRCRLCFIGLDRA